MGKQQPEKRLSQGRALRYFIEGFLFKLTCFVIMYLLQFNDVFNLIVVFLGHGAIPN